MKLSGLHFVILLVLVLSLLSLSCQHFSISDTPLIIREPGKLTCFEVKVLSWQESVYPKDVCDEMFARGILLTPKAWLGIRKDILKNCQTNQCKQLVGAADELFLAIDKALEAVPLK